MIELKYTFGRTYIRITNPNLPDRNYGYISPKDGQISVKKEMMELIEKAKKYIPVHWKDDHGRHGGSSYHKHTVNTSSLKVSINFIEEVFKRTNQPFKNNIEV